MADPTIIGVVSQKGGVGKSTIARMIARELAHNGFRTLIAGTDNGQSTSTQWVAARHKNGVTPAIVAQPTSNPKRALEQGFEAVVFDGKPHSTNETVDIAKLCNLLVKVTAAQNGMMMNELIIQAFNEWLERRGSR